MSSDPIAYLFRFRDLVQPTIQQHQTVIDAHHACWWGWWKRPSEDSRLDVWRTLRDQASLTKPVPVGLFDSGSTTGTVYRAWVTEVILPKEDSSLEQRPDVPDAEKELIPHYYRESPFSRAWMKIIKIDDPIHFFGEYSFVDVPRLPNYSLHVLKRFESKVILE